MRSSRMNRHPLVLALATAMLVPALPALAQSNNDQEQAKTLDAVQVTGSRIKRAEIEGALPVTVISREEIVASGDISVADYLRDTSFNSFGSYQSTSGSSGGGAAQISLRGIGAQRTLILLDGRRMPNAPMLGEGQNLNAIPMAAVERIEVLSDGASAIYGSDALGGVINIITRRDYEGMEFSVGVGRPSQAGGDSEEMGFLVGSSGEKSRVMAGASHNSRDIVFTRDRDYWYNIPGASVYSNNFATTPSFTVAGALKHPTYGAAVPGDCITNNNLFYTSGSGTGRTCQFDHSATSAQLTSMSNTAVFLRGDTQINENWTAYASADVARVRSFGRFAPVPSSPWPGGAIVLNPGTPNHPGTPVSAGGLNPNAADPYYASLANQRLYLFHRFAALGPRDNHLVNDNYNFIAGFEGTIGMFDVDFGGRYSESKGSNMGTNYVVAGLAQPYFNSGAYNIYNPTSAPASVRSSMTATISRDMKTSIKEVFGNASFDMFELPGGTASAAFGGEYRDEYYQDIYDPLSEGGQIVGSAGNSAAGGRDVWAVYAEALFPIIKSFEVNLAGRYDKYSDYGADFAPKISLRWHPIDSLTMRASYGEGFRAPSLVMLTQKTTFSATATTDSRTCQMLAGRPDCNTQVTTYRISNPNLGSEQSKQFSAGVVWDAANWLNLSLDYYNIKIDDQISSTTLATVVGCLRGEPGFLCPSGLNLFPVGTVLPNEALGVGAQFDTATGGIVNAQLGNVNLGTVETDGYDFQARTNFDLGWGRLRNMLALSYVHNLSSNGGANVVDAAGYPKYRGSLNNALAVGQHWDFNWNTSYIHSTKARPQDNYRLSSWVIHDVQANYKAPWDATITLGVRNLMNKDPVFNPATGGTSYDYYLYDPWGRQPYIRYTQRF